jgi:hypothetical protein
MNARARAEIDVSAGRSTLARTIPSVHCVTDDSSACPQLSPLLPNYCANGTIKTEPNFITSADGMECYIPRVHCVVDDVNSCPTNF